MLFVAEVKTHSPPKPKSQLEWGWVSNYTWDELFVIAAQQGDVVSVHTNPRWNGSFKLLDRARRLTDKPILAKGIHPSDVDLARAFDCGADYALAVGRIPSDTFLDRCWVEPTSLGQLVEFDDRVPWMVWNERDLRNGGRKEPYGAARELRAGWLCQASFIRRIEDVHLSADSFIVGTNLKGFCDRDTRTPFGTR